ncbi:alcohol dehydrogenase [Paractinoplanes abujensis]|uniref:NADPH:quinone reductase-like Zn-dependent oxidoreductase n=1 Tax=Paractinoplanes abujensis TaxID=882441 RepID=A0A7W7CK03_9ACTN|nr:NADP-dependent oxidoreductase [Actinoplanes abujensis]MBB4689895.1 NADPH:quinone reductase-like Zn-dependent oxidoreductase [Actinoplanes abujensis]GID24702.1 alcohol dehydrogenase [Actinoplanes abujensis]
MRAVVATQYGPPESFELAALPVPEPGPGQIQVRIAAVSINPGDIVIPSGAYKEQAPLTFPHVPGNDFAGTVTKIGAGVTTYGEGNLIFGHAVPRALKAMAGAHPSMTTGALAEYAVFEADTPFIAHRPPTLSPTDAAALPTVGLTTRALMATAQPVAGESVLVIGATGGVGTTLLPQLRHTRVIATGRPGDEALLHKVGAGTVIGYDDPYPTGVDLVLNLVLPTDRLQRAASALRPQGRLFTITFPPPRPEMIDRDDIRFELVLDLDGRFGGMAEVAALTPTIARVYPFEQAVQALTDFAHHHTVGKLVITV